MPVSCSSLVKGTTATSTKKSPCTITVKEFYGPRDIEMHQKYIIESYESMPTSCHVLGGPVSMISSWLNTSTKNRHMMVLIATEETSVRGMAIATVGGRGSNIYLNLICTTKTCRGAGRTIMEHLMTVALKQRCPYIELHAVSTALSFYTRLGFERVPPKTKKRPRQNNNTTIHLRLNVLWYFSCFIRSFLSANDQRNIGMVFT
jgi:GNAT superfamily N-acetyltransferase